MERKRPQLSLDELQQLKWLLGGVLALFAIWTVLYMELDTWTLLLPATLAVVAALVWPRLPARIPPWMHALGFPAIVAVFLGDLWMNAQVLPAMIRLDLMLIVFRCVGYRGKRDDLQLIVLGLFLIVVAGVLTVSLAFAVQILGFTACGLAFLLVITLVDAAEATYPAPRIPLFSLGLRAATPAWTERADWVQLFLRLCRAADWRLIVLGGLFFGGVVTVSALLFLAMPRFQWENSLFLDRFIARKSRTGFTENIRYGDVTDITSDNGLAVTVDFTDPANVPAVPYLRMLVLDDYREGGFRFSAPLRKDSMSPFSKTSRLDGQPMLQRGASSWWTFYFEPGISRFLPIPGSYMELEFTEAQNVSSSPMLRMVQLQSEPATMVAYRVRGASTASTLPDIAFESVVAGADRRSELPLLLRQKLQLDLSQMSDEGHAALRRAIAGLTGGLPPADAGKMDPVEFARRVCAWLADNHASSLQSELPSQGDDPLVRWINGTTSGHCELFAGAFVVLAREAGFPARMVTGFKGGTWNRFTQNSLTVRNDNAHAWCEIWDGKTSWLRVDPTPGSAPVSTEENRGAVAKRFDNSWSARLDSLRILWYRRVVNFDQASQVQTLDSLKRATEQSGKRLRLLLEQIVNRVKDWVRGPWDSRRLAGVAGTGALAALLIWAWNTWGAGWRWNWGTAVGGRRVDPVRAEAGRWLMRMAEARGRRTEDRVRMTEYGTTTMGELMRLRYASPATWPKPDRVFRDARRVWRGARRS